MTKYAGWGTVLKIGDQDPVDIESASWVGSVATFNTRGVHGYSSAQTVTISGCVPVAWNITGTITVTDTDSFTMALVGDPGAMTTLGRAKKADSYATIGAVRDVSGPGLTMVTPDVTTHDSTAAWREFVAAVIDAGEVTFDVVYDPGSAVHTGLRDDLVARQALRSFQLIDPSATETGTFEGAVTGWSETGPVEGELAAAITLKLNGVASWA